MPNKRSSPKSLDGFMPQSNAPRRVGFDVVRKKKPVETRPTNFPTVGQTLSSYTPNSPASSLTAESSRIAPSPFDLDFDEPTKDKKPRRFRRLRSLFRWKRMLLIVFLILLGIGGWLGFKFVYNASKTFHGSIFSVLSTAKLNGEDVGRVNILLAGNSSDDVGHSGADLTDSIMIVSLDTKNNTAFMLSVPRDLWVNIPGFGHSKINAAYVDGESEKFSQSGYFPGGMGLLQQVIQSNFNLTLNYYALIDYTAMRDMVNAVGGIDVTINSSDPRGIYDPSIDYVTHGPLVKLTNGTHLLNGEEALDLARARGDSYGSYGFPASDFNRTANQRLELLALKSKMLSSGVLANPVRLASLFDAVGNNVSTDLTLGDARRAYDIGKGVTNIQSIGLNSVNGKDYLASYTASDGEEALIPAAGEDDFTDIQALVQQLTSNNPVAHEGATVVVLNGTSADGVAAAASTKLTADDVTVAATGDATAQQATTTIIDNSGGKMPDTKKLLESLYGDNVTTTNPYASVYTADFIVILGQNQVSTTTQTSQ